MNFYVAFGTLGGALYLGASGRSFAGAAALAVFCSAWYLWRERDAMEAAVRDSFQPGDEEALPFLAKATVILGITAAVLIIYACAFFLARWVA